jgi:putative drug exporter of the RND superfamily
VVVALVLQVGWAGRAVGIDKPTPLPSFVPMLMFAVLFGLSVDHEAFVVARLREASRHPGENATDIVQGLAGSAFERGPLAALAAKPTTTRD